MANTDLTFQEMPAHATASISTAPLSFELRDAGKITLTSEDTTFRVWFSNEEDVAIPAAAFLFQIGDTPEYSLRGMPQKTYVVVACDSGSGTIKLIQE